MKTFMQRMRAEGAPPDATAYKTLITQHLIESDYAAASDAVRAAEADAAACSSARAQKGGGAAGGGVSSASAAPSPSRVSSPPAAAAAAAANDDAAVDRNNNSGDGGCGGGGDGDGGGGGGAGAGLACRGCGAESATFSKQQLKRQNALTRRCLECIAQKQTHQHRKGQQNQQAHHATNRALKLERMRKHNNVYVPTTSNASKRGAAAREPWATASTMEALRKLAVPGTIPKKKLWSMRAKAVWRYTRTAGEDGHTAAWDLYDTLVARVPGEVKEPLAERFLIDMLYACHSVDEQEDKIMAKLGDGHKPSKVLVRALVGRAIIEADVELAVEIIELQKAKGNGVAQSLASMVESVGGEETVKLQIQLIDSMMDWGADGRESAYELFEILIAREQLDPAVLAVMVEYCEQHERYEMFDKYPAVFGMPGVTTQRAVLRGLHAITTIAMFASIPGVIVGM